MNSNSRQIIKFVFLKLRSWGKRINASILILQKQTPSHNRYLNICVSWCTTLVRIPLRPLNGDLFLSITKDPSAVWPHSSNMRCPTSESINSSKIRKDIWSANKGGELRNGSDDRSGRAEFKHLFYPGRSSGGHHYPEDHERIKALD